MAERWGSFRLIRRLATGGMGEVWLARKEGAAGFERSVVVKRLRAELSADPERSALLEREARLAAGLCHPGIAQVHDLVERDGHLFIVLEHVEGVDTRILLKEAGPLPPSLAAFVVSRALEALHHAHTRLDESGESMGLVHQDFSPENLMVTFGGQVKVIDFGIARAARGRREPATGWVGGKTAYLAPEQLRGDGGDRRVDVLAAGAVLWELVTGERLFRGASDLAIMQAICDGRLPDPPPSMPEALHEIVLRAVAGDPDDRFESAHAFHLALESYLQSTAAPVLPHHLAAWLEEQLPAAVRDGGSSAETDPPAPATATARSASDPIARSDTVKAPTGVVALVFTDIEGSSGLWERTPAVMREALRVHDEVLRLALRPADGFLVKSEGDAFLVAFGSPLEALRWCLSVQEALLSAPWPDAVHDDPAAAYEEDTRGRPLHRGLRVRMGVHLGEVEGRRDPATGGVDYIGPTVNRAARVCGAAHGGQILVSGSAERRIAEGIGRGEAGPGDDVLSEARWTDLGAFRLKGLESAERLFQVLPTQLEGRSFPPPNSQSARTTNIVPPATSFVGRVADLSDLAGHLERGARLITVVGSGGTGKTRLALHFGALQQDRWHSEGGVWFCDQSESRTLEGLCNGVAAALELRTGPRDAEAACRAVGEALAARGSTLLVLDNLEQVVEPARAALSIWLEQAPRLRVVATSQVALGLDQEVVHRLGPLSCKPDGDGPSDAVALLGERARAARPGFCPSAEDGRVLEELVARLDGLPLAIELAAARLAIFTPAQILERLDRRFDLLGARGAAGRHGTLHAAIAWSWDLLDAAEQAVLAQCAVFRGGFTLDAAEAVVDLSTVPDAPWVPDLVQALCERSLLRSVDPASGAGPLRFAYYESIRAFSLARLEEKGWAEAARWRHARHYADWAVEVVDRESEIGAQALVPLHDDVENLLSAHETAMTREDATGAEVALATATAAHSVLTDRGSDEVSLKCLRAALAHPRHLDVAPARRGEAFLGVGTGLWRRGRFEEATAVLQEGRALAEDAGEIRLQGRCARVEALAAAASGDEAKAREILTRARAMLAAGGHHRSLAAVLNSLANLASKDAAIDLYREAISIFEQSGDETNADMVRGNLGAELRRMGRRGEARELLEAALAGARRRGHRRNALVALTHMAVLAYEEGRLDAAERFQRASVTTCQAVGEVRVLGLLQGNLGHILHLLGRLEEAESWIASGLAACRRSGDRRRLAEVLIFEADLLHELGRLEEARARYEETLTLHEAAGDGASAAVAEAGLGAVRVAAGEAEAGFRRLDAAEARQAGDDGHRRTLALYRGLAELAAGDRASAERRLSLWRERPDFTDGSQCAGRLLGRALNRLG